MDIAAAKARQHSQRHWPMRFLVEMRVAFKVIMKCRGVGVGDFHLDQQRLEHSRHDVLAAKRKRRRHPVWHAGSYHIKGRLHELPGRLRHLALGQAPSQAVRGDTVDKIVDTAEVGPDLAHRLAVHVEVTNVLRLATGQCTVRLLLGDDLVDEAPYVAVAVRQPRRNRAVRRSAAGS